MILQSSSRFSTFALHILFETLLDQPMNFFNLPAEIRLGIYSELLVRSEPIVFVAGYGPSSLPLFRAKRDGLCPALLRTNRKLHHEASPLLYSNNRFQFPEIGTKSAHIAPFLNQI
jgi:hypothetical protein